MSGWIKIEKSLETDPRTVRLAKALTRRFEFMTVAQFGAGGSNAGALPAVTLVCGALSRLWIYADSHIREDNTLDMSAAEIDEWIGIPGFCDLLPDDWLVPVDEKSVELPGFLAHNGVEAKKKALTSKRVENHRIRNSVSDCNAPALPDQTRPDLDQTIQAARAVPRETESQIHAHVLEIKADWPRGCAHEDWITGEKLIRNLVLAGESWEAIKAGVKRYAAFCKATGRMVANPGRWFAEISRPWLSPWAVPPKPGEKPAPNREAEWAEAKAAAKDIGFRDPDPMETATSYMTAIRSARDAKPMAPLAERRGLAGIKRVTA